MSLINDMLKDLEKNGKQKETPLSDQAALPNLKSVIEEEKLSCFAHYMPIVRIAALILLLLLLVVLTYFLISKKTARSLSAPVPIVSSPTPIRTADQTPTIVQPTQVQLQELSVEQVQQTTKLVLIFSDPVHYELDLSDDHTVLSLRLNNTTLSGVMPDLKALSTAIESIQSNVDQQDLVLSIKLKPNTVVQAVDMTEAAPIQLSLLLSNADATAATSEVADKPPMISTGGVEKQPLSNSSDALAEKNYQDALHLISQDQIDLAITKLENGLAQAPNYVEARTALIKLLLKKGLIQEALTSANDGLALTPDSIALIQLKARAQLQNNQLQAALTTLHQISPMLTDAPDYYALMANIQQRLGHASIAAQLYAQLLEKWPDHAIWWVGLGAALESQRQPNAAAQAYHRALTAGELSPDLQAFVQMKLAKMGGG